MTYLQLVNSVLVRLREAQVSTVTQTTYSTLIGTFINDAKKRVEDAYTWNALKQTITVSTVGGTQNYTLTGSGQRFKVLQVINNTNDYELRLITSNDMNQYTNFGTQQNGDPFYYTFNGIDSNGDNNVDIYPIPNGVQSLRFDLIIPQDDLSSDSTMMLIPADPVIFSAYALASAERGEDQGLASSEAIQIARTILGDTIAIEASRHYENDSWSTV